MTPKEFGYTNSPWGDSNELREHIRRLNELERQKQELKKQYALNKIKQLREKQRNEQRNVIPQ